MKLTPKYGQRNLWLILFCLISITMAISITIAFLITLWPSTKAIASFRYTTKQELRGVWLTNVDSDVLFSAKTLKQAVERLATLNFNTIYPTVWQGSHTFYQSRVMQRETGRAIDPHPGLKRRDPLQELIKEGHRKGLAIIPWFEFGFMLDANSILAQRRPQWLTQNQQGMKIWKEGKDDRVWLNPFHPEVQKFIIELVTEIVANYNVDGIQFDDHFGLPVEFGYDRFTSNLYQQEIKQPPPLNPQETFWVRWRADQINQFMGKLFFAIKKANPKCIVSVSPNPLHFALPAHLQDWFTWERRGYVEELILQVYRSDLPRFISEMERTEVELAKNHIPVSIGILTGLKNRPIPMSQIGSQVAEVRKRKFAGVSFFFYESLLNLTNENESERLKFWQKMFPASIKRPVIS